eukprot:4716952-Heterocapsa_arctica.AAC.1
MVVRCVEDLAGAVAVTTPPVLAAANLAGRYVRGRALVRAVGPGNDGEGERGRCGIWCAQ